MSVSKKNLEELVQLNNAFYKKEEVVDGKTFSIFSYHIANFSDFKDYEELGSLEARGIVFLEEEPFLAFHKFFNYKENPYTNIDIPEDKEILVQEKIDGSFIHPIVVEGNIYVKSKTTFFSEQAKIAKEIIENKKEYKDLILSLYSQNFIPLFELVSPKNQIVVPYQEEHLVLLAVRNRESGKYASPKEIEDIGNYYKIPFAKHNVLSFKEIREILLKEKYLEGFVAKVDNLWIKFKTKWYLSLHSIVAELREDVVFEYVLEEKIDDLLSFFADFDTSKKREIEKIASISANKINEAIKEALNLFEKYKELEFNRKNFALAYNKHPYFSAVIRCSSEEEVIAETKRLLKKRYRTYTEVLNFLGLS